MPKVRVTVTVDLVENDERKVWSHTETQEGGYVGSPRYTAHDVGIALNLACVETKGAVEGRFGALPAGAVVRTS